MTADRSRAHTGQTVARLRSTAPEGRVEALELELGSLASVAAAAQRLRSDHERLDLLVNNTGMLGSVERTTTQDGFEATLEANHLGVFALTGVRPPLPDERITGR